jgi:hypothetical protein
MASALDIMQAANPPRIAFLDYPLGHTTGKPNEPELQRDILTQALASLTSLGSPGTLPLPFKWTDEEAWKETAERGPDERLPRHDTPQYQCELDRLLAEANQASGAVSADGTPQPRA